MSGADLFDWHTTGKQMNAGTGNTGWYDEDKIVLDTSEAEKAEMAAWREQREQLRKKKAEKNKDAELYLRDKQNQ